MTTASRKRIRIRRTTVADWRQLRELRLSMVEETPYAYLETLADARRTSERTWRERAARGSSPDAITLAALADDGRWVGTMMAFLPRSGRQAELVAVYVDPRHRGRAHGVTDALLDQIEDWARRRAGRLVLEVDDRNPRARRAYARRGFVETGGSRPHPLDDRVRLIEMSKSLRAGTPGAPTGALQLSDP